MLKNKILIHIPHSSLKIPKIFKSRIIISYQDLIKENKDMCDLYVNKLININNYNVVKFNYSRMFCDVERFKNDDFEEMSKIGMGAIYECTSKHKNFINIDSKYKNYVLNNFYDKHHNSLDNMCEEILNKYNSCIIVDLHSFSNKIVKRLLNKKNNPDICIGIDYNFYDKKLEEIVCNFLKNKNYKLKINYPYTGSIIPNKYYRSKNKNIKTIMIEINKKLYLKNNIINKDNFKKLKKDIKELLELIEKNF